jgi:hypothetical protein
MFHSTLSKIFYSTRSKLGEIITNLYKLDKKFEEDNGIVGYKTIKEEHIAIIFPSDSSKNFKVTTDNEIEKLKKHYESRNENYKVYFCFLVDDFIKIVKSEYVYGVHVFGHGRINGITLEDGQINYREFKGTKPKEFVVQWHCNHGDFHQNSLGRMIGKKYYVKYGMRNAFSNKRDIKKLINGKLEWIQKDL